MLKVYVFGNEDVKADNTAIEVVKKVGMDFKNIEFVQIKPNQDLPFGNNHDVILMDVIEGIKDPQLFDEQSLRSLALPPRYSAHDFDLGFQLKYLQKLGMLGKIFIIGIPKDKKANYKRIISIFKKLVAQDIQGS